MLGFESKVHLTLWDVWQRGEGRASGVGYRADWSTGFRVLRSFRVCRLRACGLWSRCQVSVHCLGLKPETLNASLALSYAGWVSP